jgi:hypothetical protein
VDATAFEQLQVERDQLLWTLHELSTKLNMAF